MTDTDNLSTEQRLQRALSQLIDHHGAERTPGTVTATALCRLAGVSRTTLYRYHPGVLQSLHQWQRKHPGRAGPDQKTLMALREEWATLRTQVRDLSGSELVASELSLRTVTNNTPPAFSSAAVNGDELEITFNGDLDTGSEPDAGDFAVTVAGEAAALADTNPVDVAGTAVTLTWPRR